MQDKAIKKFRFVSGGIMTPVSTVVIVSGTHVEMAKGCFQVFTHKVLTAAFDRIEWSRFERLADDAPDTPVMDQISLLGDGEFEVAFPTFGDN